MDLPQALEADARAIARLATRTGRNDLTGYYQEKADAIRKRMDELLWDDAFYRVFPCQKESAFKGGLRPEVPKEHRVRELLGYLP